MLKELRGVFSSNIINSSADGSRESCRNNGWKFRSTKFTPVSVGIRFAPTKLPSHSQQIQIGLWKQEAQAIVRDKIETLRVSSLAMFSAQKRRVKSASIIIIVQSSCYCSLWGKNKYDSKLELFHNSLLYIIYIYIRLFLVVLILESFLILSTTGHCSTPPPESLLVSSASPNQAVRHQAPWLEGGVDLNLSSGLRTVKDSSERNDMARLPLKSSREAFSNLNTTTKHRSETLKAIPQALESHRKSWTPTTPSALPKVSELIITSNKRRSASGIASRFCGVSRTWGARPMVGRPPSAMDRTRWCTAAWRNHSATTT